MGKDENYPSQFKNVIEKIVDAELEKKGITKYISALVKGINDNGTVNVCIPPNLDATISGLLNKTGETLSVGDSVELCAKNGSVNNSWVAIKHKTNNEGGGTSNHAKLTNLDYANSGHTGFAGTGISNTFSQTQIFDGKVTVNNSLRAKTFQNTYFCPGTGATVGVYCKLCNIKFDYHRQGEFANMRVYIGYGNNSKSKQNAFIDLTMQLGWYAEENGRVGCYWELHPGETTFTTSNCNMIVIANSNIDYDVYFYTTVRYCCPNYSVDCSDLVTVTHVGTTSTTAPTGTACNVSGGLVCTLDKIYPVGSIYLSINSTNPSTLFGGTWQRIDGYYLYAGPDSTLNQTGGSWTTGSTTLSIEQIPSHSHNVAVTSSGAHSHATQGRTGGTSPTPSIFESYAGASGTRTVNVPRSGTNGAHTHTITQDSIGGGQGHTHSMTPPFIQIAMWIRTA